MASLAKAAFTSFAWMRDLLVDIRKSSLYHSVFGLVIVDINEDVIL